jgi:hypothetical protein
VSITRRQRGFVAAGLAPRNHPGSSLALMLAMIRSLFLSVGLIVGLLGVSCLAIERVVLKTPADRRAIPGLRNLVTGVSNDRKQMIEPPDWLAYALMSVGSVMTLYTVALPGKGGGKKSAKKKDD